MLEKANFEIAPPSGFSGRAPSKPSSPSPGLKREHWACHDRGSNIEFVPVNGEKFAHADEMALDRPQVRRREVEFGVCGRGEKSQTKACCQENT